MSVRIAGYAHVRRADFYRDDSGRIIRFHGTLDMVTQKGFVINGDDLDESLVQTGDLIYIEGELMRNNYESAPEKIIATLVSVQSRHAKIGVL